MSEWIDDYELIRPLGTGASASVWEARGPTGTVALKKLHQTARLGAEQRQRLQREARVLNRIDHRCVVKVLDFGVHDDTPYLVMELLAGRTLTDVLEQGLSIRDGLQLARSVVEGLAAVHRMGIVHRDVKPDNVLVTEQGVKLVDFGLVKFMDTEEWGQHSAITAANVQVGTPAYMAPEICFGEPAGFRSDVYSVGIMLFECVTGQLPFEGESRVAWVRHHATTVPPPASSLRANVSRKLDAVIAKCLEKERAHRFADATELVDALLTV